MGRSSRTARSRTGRWHRLRECSASGVAMESCTRAAVAVQVVELHQSHAPNSGLDGRSTARRARLVTRKGAKISPGSLLQVRSSARVQPSFGTLARTTAACKCMRLLVLGRRATTLPTSMTKWTRRGGALPRPRRPRRRRLTRWPRSCRRGGALAGVTPADHLVKAVVAGLSRLPRLSSLIRNRAQRCHRTALPGGGSTFGARRGPSRP